MSRRLRLAAAAAGLVLVGAGAAVAVPASAAPAPATLFSDDFSGSAGAKDDNFTEWSGCTYNASAYYGNIKCGDRAHLDGEGHLVIPATPTEGTSVSTKDTFTAVYGTFTARMKVPTEAGYWPAFWLLNNNPNGQDAGVIGESDIHESYTGLANYYHRGIHNYSANTWGSPGDPACGRDRVFGEWHDYSVKIEPNQQTYYFDGVQCGDVAKKSDGGGKPYAFGPDVTRGNWPILTLAVGGAGGQQDPGTGHEATKPADLLVDSVTVTALDGGDPQPTTSPTATPSPTASPTACVPTPTDSPTAAPAGVEMWPGADGSPWAGWSTWRNASVQSGKGRLGLTATQNYSSAYWTSQQPVTDFDLTTTVKPGVDSGAFRVGVSGAATNDNEPRDGQTVKFGLSGGKVTELVIRSSKAGNSSEVAYAPISAKPVTPSAAGVQVRVQRTGATVQAKVWPAGAVEPSAWTITGTDKNPPAASGRVFLSAVGSGAGYLDFDDLTVK